MPIPNSGKNNELSKNTGNNTKHLSISIEKINNKEVGDNNNNYLSNYQFKFNHNIMSKEEKKINNENSPKFLNEKLFNNCIIKESHKNNGEKTPNLIEKILNNQNINKNIKLENDINSNNMNTMNTIDINNENNDNKNKFKNTYQFRIRKINLPSGINMACIQHNNKLLQNLINKKSKKNKGVLNANKILVSQTEYKIMKGEK